MKYNIYILSILFTFLCVNKSYSQITIGSDIEPASFSLVQVEGSDGGVHLPRMTSSEMTTLGASMIGNSESQALVVYNTSDNRMEFWDGSAWVPLTATSTSGSNAITSVVTPQGLKLGGDLTKTTEIDMKDFNFSFKYNTGTSEQLSIGSVKVKNDEVDLTIPAAGTFTVNTNALNVNSSTRNIGMAAEKITLNQDLLTIEDASVAGTGVKGTLNYPHSSKGSGYLLVSDDANGNASWGAVRPMGTIETGTLSDNTFFWQNNDQNITTKYLKLSPGQWMIFAKYTGRMVSAAALMYQWLQLEKTTTNPSSGTPSWTSLGRGGANPELITTGSTSTFLYCTPSYSRMVNITETTYYRVVAMTSNPRNTTSTNTTTMQRNTRTVPDFGGSYFYAVRIDVEDPSNPY